MQKKKEKSISLARVKRKREKGEWDNQWTSKRHDMKKREEIKHQINTSIACLNSIFIMFH